MDLKVISSAVLRLVGFFPPTFDECAIPCSQLTDVKTYLLAGEQSRAGIEEQAKKVRLLISGYRAMTGALKKGCSDMTSALKTAQTAQSLRERQAEAKAKAKTRTPKLPAFASTSDPSAIKMHRTLTKRSEIEKATSFEALKTCNSGEEPFILRCFGLHR